MKYTNPMYSNLHARPNGRISARAASLAFLTLLALPASAVTVLNHSFEIDVAPTPDGGFSGPAVTSWTDINSGGDPSTGRGTYNPSESELTGAGGSGTGVGGDGSTVFTTYTGNALNAYAGLSQVLPGTTLTAGTVYTMTVAIADYLTNTPANWHLAISTSSMAFGSYLNDFSGLGSNLTDGQFKDFSVSYTATGAEGQIGEDLKITLWGQNDGTGTHVAFDNVRFTAVPEPSAALLGGLGLLFLARRRRN